MASYTESIVLGGGCFWCLDAAYRLIKGVTKVTSGYAGGFTDNPNYYQVASGASGHAEVVKVEFMPEMIKLLDILDIFWAIHDPTSLNRQGNDTGTQYRSAVFYTDKDQKKIIDQSLQGAKEIWDNKIVTEIQPLVKFYPAEAEHQDYFINHPEQAYCKVIINPKLKKLRQKFSSLLNS